MCTIVNRKTEIPYVKGRFAVGKMHRMLVINEKFAHTWNSGSKSQL